MNNFLPIKVKVNIEIDESALMIEEVENENNLLRTKVKSLEDEL